MKIKKPTLLKSASDMLSVRSQFYKLSMVVSVLIIGLGVLASYIFSYTIQNQLSEDFNKYKAETSQNVNDYISNKITSYESLLIAASSNLRIKDPNSLTRNDWNLIYDGLQIERRTPEILGFGYTEYVPASQLTAHTEKMRTEIPSYNLTPAGPRAEYTAIKFIEPYDELNKKAIGFDMFSETNRQKAMASARDTARAQMTNPVLSIQDERNKATDKPKSVLVYFPIYKSGFAPKEVENRRKNLVGYVYFVIRAQDMIRNQEAQWSKEIKFFRLSDISDGKELLYSVNFEGNNSEVINNHQEFNVAGRTWQTEIGLDSNLSSSIFTPGRVFTAGLIFSLLVGSVLFMLLARRAKALKDAHEEEIQKTKDELLALASHQLRTPATAVRQYVSMLSAGYFGKLGKEQKNIAEKAFIANERQLEIIDQILYVAKADAGQLMLSREKVNVANLISKIIDEFGEALDKKRITLTYKKPKATYASLDERYVSMIIENLISNAIKYSYPESKISVALKQDGEKSVVIRIKDRGVGISHEDQSKLFQKFSRIENPLSRLEGGSGLGLFLANRLAVAHDGKLEVKSDTGKGSTFIITLPKNQENEKNVVQLTDS